MLIYRFTVGFGIFDTYSSVFFRKFPFIWYMIQKRRMNNKEKLPSIKSENWLKFFTFLT